MSLVGMDSAGQRINYLQRFDILIFLCPLAKFCNVLRDTFSCFVKCITRYFLLYLQALIFFK